MSVIHRVQEGLAHGRDALYNTLVEFELPMKLVRLIEICLNRTYNTVLIGKNLFAEFPIRMV
jgi:hypothetical protein